MTLRSVIDLKMVQVEYNDYQKQNTKTDYTMNYDKPSMY